MILAETTYSFGEFILQTVSTFWEFTGFYNCTVENIIMLAVGCFFVWLAIKKNFEPLLLVPIGFGMLIGNIPFQPGMEIGIYEPGSVLNILYNGVERGWYPPLIFLGIGAMTDFSALLANPKLMIIGACAQFGIFGAYMLALLCGFDPLSAGCVAIIGGADGPTAIFTTSKLNPNLLGAVAVSAYSYMALIPLIQPPLMRLFTTKEERLIKMKPARVVSQNEKIIFPIVGLMLTCFVVPSGIPLLGMLFFGNLLRESGVTSRLAKTASNAMTDIVTILLGHTGRQVPYFRHADYIRPRICGIHHCIVIRCAFSETFQPFPQKRQKDQSAHRQRRCVGCAYGGSYLKQSWVGIRPHQLPAHACYGPKCGRRDWFRSSGRRAPQLPGISTAYTVAL